MFDTNAGRWDRGLRLLLGVLMGAVGLSGAGGPAATVAAALVTVSLFATAAVGFCPLYVLLGVDTCPARSADR